MINDSMHVHEHGAFLSKLQQHAERCQQDGLLLGLILIRVRRCDEVRNSLGYEAGNLLLSGLAERISSILRKDDVFERIGDNAFALVIPKLRNIDHVSLAVNRILDLMEDPFEIEGNAITASIAMGITLFPEQAQDANDMFQFANIALSEAVEKNHPFRIFTALPEHNDIPSFTMENELRHALVTDEFILHFQPKININTRQVCGTEVLSRWVNMARGFVSPDVFIPVAEKTNLMLPFTLWTLNLTGRHYAEMKQFRKDLTISVNLSAAILHDPDVVDLVTRIIRIWGIEPGQLVLEVTESAMMMDPNNSLETLKRFHDIGVGLSIDDFGTGYSSLAYVKRLPVDELKIDKSFIMNMDKDKGDAMIVRTIIDMAHNFDISVTAEGVESQLILDQLADLGCDCAQGFHIAHPMAIKDLHEWMNISPWATGLGAKVAAKKLQSV